MSPKRIVSIITGCLSALGLAYVGLSNVWGFGYATQVQETIGIIVQLLSTCLAVVTGMSIAAESANDIKDPFVESALVDVDAAEATISDIETVELSEDEGNREGFELAEEVE